MNKAITSAIVVYLMLGLVLMPKMCMDSALKGIDLCINIVIPTLFPFFVCSKLLIKNGFAKSVSSYFGGIMRPLFNVPGCGAFALLIGLISGCPVGARTVVDMYKKSLCTKTEAQRMISFCNNAGPLFIMGSVSVGMLGCPHLSGILYLSHIISAIIVGVVMSNYRKKEKITTQSFCSKAEITPSGGISESISESAAIMGYVCGFVVFFSVATAIFRQSGIAEVIAYRFSDKSLCKSVIYGMLEMTNGISSLSECKISIAMLGCVSFLLGFGGLSVILQVYGIISKHGLSIGLFTLTKLLQGIISSIITYIVISRAEISLPTLADVTKISIMSYWANSIKIIAVFGIIIFIMSIIRIVCKTMRRV